MFELSDVGFVKRIVVGNSDPDLPHGEANNDAAISLLNRCLGEAPRGRILGIEKASVVRNEGGKEVVAQSLTYHVGWQRRPPWLME